MHDEMMMMKITKTMILAIKEIMLTSMIMMAIAAFEMSPHQQ